MTYDEWIAYAADINHVVRRSRAIVYALEDETGAIQLLLQPRRRVDVTTLRWPTRRVMREAPVH